MTTWEPDVLGDGYQQLTLPLGIDPDGEGEIEATLVRYQPPAAGDGMATRAVIYIHGFTDYFFQQHLAEHFAGQGYLFFALDLRKCGRSRRPGQTPHYVTDLRLYDAELNEALRVVREQTCDGEILLVAHSTGGLILPLWLHRLNKAPGGAAGAGIAGVVLNSPWFDLHGPAYLRSVGANAAVDVVGRLKSKSVLPGRGIDTYGSSIHSAARGQWDYNLDWKPLTGFPVRFGWLRAIRRGHARLHRGLDIGVPSLILRSKSTRFAPQYNPEVDTADAVLDVEQIARWSGCLGDRTTIIPIEGARHDVFLSTEQPRAAAFRELDLWLTWLDGHRTAESARLGDQA